MSESLELVQKRVACAGLAAFMDVPMRKDMNWIDVAVAASLKSLSHQTEMQSSPKHLEIRLTSSADLHIEKVPSQAGDGTFAVILRPKVPQNTAVYKTVFLNLWKEQSWDRMQAHSFVQELFGVSRERLNSMSKLEVADEFASQWNQRVEAERNASSTGETSREGVKRERPADSPSNAVPDAKSIKIEGVSPQRHSPTGLAAEASAS